LRFVIDTPTPAALSNLLSPNQASDFFGGIVIYLSNHVLIQNIPIVHITNMPSTMYSMYLLIRFERFEV